VFWHAEKQTVNEGGRNECVDEGTGNFGRV
jgi:hypothetical protein